MRIYKMRSDSDRYQHVIVFPGEDKSKLLPSEARSLKKKWTPTKTKLLTKNNLGEPLLTTDAPGYVPDVLIFSRCAVDALRVMLDGEGEILPLQCNEAELFFFNVTKQINALDTKNSDIMWGKMGNILWINRYAFLGKEELRNAIIFKMPGLYTLYVTDKFVDAINESHIHGLEFTELWHD